MWPKPGDFVRVRAYGGEVVPRLVVAVHFKGVLVCRPEEYELSRSEGRAPRTVGVAVEDLVPDGREAVESGVRKP